ncbi:hypothetical protein L596_026081 [Steinernema carpocapsae]|uniref:G-protein coupled receptors family 1 profile domain-containing protein n=1 Tax=Steinernema carpocapsae TaxID=34508 RepID=A0A4U5M0B4_STECR|nr:hypothetical protein L596_026081 [Steinernema carpocapsae]
MWSRYVFGGTGLFIPVIFTLLYARIICIFLFQRKYRNTQCYSIMIQMGIAQCQDHCNLAAVTVTFMTVATRAEGILSLALALNRMHVICYLSYPPVVYKILIFIAWGYAVGHYFFYVIPCCALSTMPDILTPIFNFENLYVALSNKVAAIVYGL